MMMMIKREGSPCLQFSSLDNEMRQGKKKLSFKRSIAIFSRTPLFILLLRFTVRNNDDQQSEKLHIYAAGKKILLRVLRSGPTPCARSAFVRFN